MRDREGSCERFSWAQPGMLHGASTHIPLARTVTWLHQTIREAGKCSLTTCPGEKEMDLVNS